MNHSKAEREYQAGSSRERAIANGASPQEFDALEEKYQGASIPAHIWVGFKKREPYSCHYHTGGSKGALLRAIAKDLRENPR
jgi:hypothetical protein